MRYSVSVAWKLSLLAFVVLQVILIISARIFGYDYFDSGSWSRYDSGHYLSIATTGYEYFVCEGHEPGKPLLFCGNTGWFPAYPGLIKVLAYVYNQPVTVGALLAKLFVLFNLRLIVSIAGRDQTFSPGNVLFLLAAGFSFSSVYSHAVFPVSMLLFFMLVGIYAYRNHRLALLCTACFLCSITYPTGFLFAAAVGIDVLISSLREKSVNWKQLLLPGIFGAMGLVLTFLIFHISVGHWDAFLKVQAKYGHSYQTPWKNMGVFLAGYDLTGKPDLKLLILIQAALTLFGYFTLLVRFIKNKWSRSPLYLFLFILLSLYFIFPWTVGGDLSRYRSEALLLPFIFFFKDARAGSIALLLALLIPLGLGMSYLFFTGVLI